MKWLNVAIFLISILLIGFVTFLSLRVNALEIRLKSFSNAREVNERLDHLDRELALNKSDFSKAISGIWDRLEAIEEGVGEKQPRGPKTTDYLLGELERWIHLKRDADQARIPDEEAAAQRKIDETVAALEIKAREDGEEVATLLIERARINRVPYVQAFLIREIIWRFGPDTVPGLLGLFEDADFASNLRVLAAASVMKSGGRKDELLGLFTRHLGDEEESMVVKTGLVEWVFREHTFEGAVEMLIEGARNPGYPFQHRTACLKSLSSYDHPQVIRALEEIIYKEEDQNFIVGFAIQAYARLMREKAVPYLKEVLEAGKVDKTNRSKIIEILSKYVAGEEEENTP